MEPVLHLLDERRDVDSSLLIYYLISHLNCELIHNATSVGRKNFLYLFVKFRIYVRLSIVDGHSRLVNDHSRHKSFSYGAGHIIEVHVGLSNI